MSDEQPTLWHIEVSHYSEKARWALAWKRVEHRRRAPIPSVHMAVALWLSRGTHYTFPVLSVGGRNICDSTEIVAELERRWPEPPLYPAEPDERRRALQLEDFFDEQLGPPIRQLVWHELSKDPDRFALLMERTSPPSLARFSKAAAQYGRVFTALRFAASSDEAAERSRAMVAAALDRLDAELEAGGEYLVGDSFTVADLTAASLFYPLALPESAPLPPDQPLPGSYQRFREPLKDRPGMRWVREIYRRHRTPTKSAPAATAA